MSRAEVPLLQRSTRRAIRATVLRSRSAHRGQRPLRRTHPQPGRSIFFRVTPRIG